ncbi:hypothetical protein, partial [Klebsiella quasipneumoniae]
PTTYLVDTTLSDASDYDQTVHAVRLPFSRVSVNFVAHKTIKAESPGASDHFFNQPPRQVMLKNNLVDIQRDLHFFGLVSHASVEFTGQKFVLIGKSQNIPSLPSFMPESFVGIQRTGHLRVFHYL